MPRTLDVDAADCPACFGKLRPVALITRQDVIDKLLSHLRLPMSPAPIGPGASIAYDLGGEPLPSWVVGVDPDQPKSAAA